MGGLEQRADQRFAFSFKHTINGTATMLQDFLGNKGRTVSPHENNTIGELRLRGGGEIKDLGYVREVVTRESDCIRLPLVHDPEVVCPAVGLEVNQPNIMSALTC